MKKKTIKIGIVLVALGILISTKIVSAQSSRQVDRLENKAYKAFTKKDYGTSLTYLLKLDSIGVPNAYYDYMIGMCLLSTDLKIQAIPYLERAKQSGKISFVIDYYLGRAYQFAGRYAEARSYLSSYASELASSAIRLSNETAVDEAHKIHVQKSLNDVRGFIAECDLMLASPNFSTVQ